MSDYKAKTIDKVAAGVQGAAGAGETVYAPQFSADIECVGPEGTKWKDGFHNAVMLAGKAHILNRLWGSAGTGVSSVGAFVYLHSASNATVTSGVWPDISASRLTAFGNDVPRATFASSYTGASATATCSYGFTSNMSANQTCSGAAIMFYTAATMSTNAATGDMLEYSAGTFSASRLIQAADTLNVSLTIAYA